MAQFSLPQNSKIEVGNYFKDKTNSKNLRKINVYRWDPSTGKNPRVDTFEVDMDNCGPKVLDILFKIKNEIDPSLTFRRSCAHGVCGSCAMNIDGTNTLACTKAISDVKGDIKIYPLPHMPVIKDLVVDMDTFFDKWIAVGGVHHPSKNRHQSIEKISESSAERISANEAVECINCGVCYASCDVVSANSDYFGPAALNRAWSLVNDVKTENKRGHTRRCQW